MDKQYDQKRPLVGVAVLVIKEGQILLGKRKGAHGTGEWSCPGGHLEFGERVEDCAKRELEEETGLKAHSLQLGPWAEDKIDGYKHYITLFVLVKQFEGQVCLLEPHKCEGWQWFKWDQLPSPLFATIHSLIRKVGLENLKRIS